MGHDFLLLGSSRDEDSFWNHNTLDRKDRCLRRSCLSRRVSCWSWEVDNARSLYRLNLRQYNLRHADSAEDRPFLTNLSFIPTLPKAIPASFAASSQRSLVPYSHGSLLAVHPAQAGFSSTSNVRGRIWPNYWSLTSTPASTVCNTSKLLAPLHRWDDTYFYMSSSRTCSE